MVEGLRGGLTSRRKGERAYFNLRSKRQGGSDGNEGREKEM
jgi:hypothetical protein